MTSKYEGHTKGLRVGEEYLDDHFIEIADDKNLIRGRVHMGFPGDEHEEARANARLWADAPTLLAQRDDLLAALKVLLQAVVDEDGHDSFCDFLDDAENDCSCGADEARVLIARIEAAS